MKNIHEKIEYNCEMCKKTFAKKHVLMRHIKIVHEAQKFKCDSCDDAFSSRTSVKYHFQLKHEEISEHKCDMCGKSYTLIRYLKRHIKYLFAWKSTQKN